MKKYALLFTLLTIGLGIAANVGMKRWGTGDVINGRDLTRNFDEVIHYSKKQITNNQTTRIYLTDGGGSNLYVNSLRVSDIQNKKMLITLDSYVVDAGGAAYFLPFLKCDNTIGLDDGGTVTNTHVSLGLNPSINDGFGKYQTISMRDFTISDAGAATCYITYNADVNVLREYLKIEEY